MGGRSGTRDCWRAPSVVVAAAVIAVVFGSETVERADCRSRRYVWVWWSGSTTSPASYGGGRSRKPWDPHRRFSRPRYYPSP